VSIHFNSPKHRVSGPNPDRTQKLSSLLPMLRRRRTASRGFPARVRNCDTVSHTITSIIKFKYERAFSGEIFPTLRCGRGDGPLVAFPLPPISSLSVRYIGHRAVYLFRTYTCHITTSLLTNHHLRCGQRLEYSNASTPPVNTFHLSTRISPSPSLFALHPYLTPTLTRYIPYFPAHFYSTPSCHFWDLSLIFYFTHTPYYPDFRPIILSTSAEFCSSTAPQRNQYFLPSEFTGRCLCRSTDGRISKLATYVPERHTYNIV
jgi:hypothetical protein